MLEKAYGESIFQWDKRFAQGRESIKVDQRLGRPVSVTTPQTVIKINRTVRANRRISIWMIVETVNTDIETIRKILHTVRS